MGLSLVLPDTSCTRCHLGIAPLSHLHCCITANGEALNEASEQGDACVRACLDCIEYCRAHVNPNVIFFVENPGYGAFRKLPCVVPYIHSGQSRMLQYGDYAPDTHSLKPTIVLTNCTSWHPLPMCRTKSVVHWNRLSKKRRTVIPRAVCEEVWRQQQ